jgi:Ca2+-dependent lipid-binding protein
MTASPCISVPHFAAAAVPFGFHSEFNVQMLYLPGLKMFLPIFVPPILPTGAI